jgi:pimeloyl-ACP methyl ester carboxylesterase
MAAGLPAAIHAAAQGDFSGLVGLSGAVGGSKKSGRLAMGMHFSVVCAEDAPRMELGAHASAEDFSTVDADLYASVCKFWPRGTVPDAFYSVPTAQSPVLVLSGGADPVTPPRHGERITQSLGAKAQHIVVPEAGHGVMGLGCMRDVVFRFVTADTDAQALPQDASCAIKVPRPGVFLPVQMGGSQEGSHDSH